MSELRAYDAEPTWFALGDRDLGTHLVRTQLLNAGYPLSEVTAALAGRWLAGDPALRLLPMTDDRVETHITIAETGQPAGGAPSTSRSTGCGCEPGRMRWRSPWSASRPLDRRPG